MSGFLPGGQLHGPRNPAQRAARRLLRAGCGEPELQLILDEVARQSRSEEERANRLLALVDFARDVGRPAARDYFRAIRETRATAQLTDDRLLSFARSLDPHTAEWYFWALWGTGAVEDLTSGRVLRAIKFFRAIDSPSTVEYFLAIRETKEAAALTAEKVLAFAQEIGSDAALEFFGACWETKAVKRLTADRVLEFARSVGPETAREYFRALRETRAVTELTREPVLALATSVGGTVAKELFLAIRETKEAAELTKDDVLLFAELIGRGPARQYFRALASTKAVAALTRQAVLRTSGVIRSIGSDAALDYFLALASSKVAPRAGTTAADDADARSLEEVPVLTLLELPDYGRYRPVGLAAATALFWAGLWRYAPLAVDPSGGFAGLATALVACAGLLAGLHVLLGALAERSTEQFLQRRRRLLNEHGIRWHDCGASGVPCPVCWSSSRTHDDRRYDHSRFCRCTAC